ncbi:MAG: potassium channel family protein [Pseudomonas sp.]
MNNLNSTLLRYKFRFLLASILLVLAVLSFPQPDLLLELGSILFMVLAGLNTVRFHNRLAQAISVAGVVSLLLLFIPNEWSLNPVLRLGIPQIIFFLLLAFSIFHRVTQERPVTSELFYGLCALYLNFSLAFALAYNLIEGLFPNSFQSSFDQLGLDKFVYFSMITLTTIGYGDVSPVHPLARLLAGLEAIMGVLFTALVVARVLSLMDDSRE